MSLLANGQSLSFSTFDSAIGPGLTLKVPKTAPANMVPVIKTEIPGKLDVIRVLPQQNEAGAIHLPPELADLHSRSYNYNDLLRLETEDGVKYFGNWQRNRDWIGWQFEFSQPGTFEVTAEVALPESTKLKVQLRDDDSFEALLNSTGDYSKYESQALGQISIKQEGEYQLEIRAAKEGWHPVNMRSLTLTPAK